MIVDPSVIPGLLLLAAELAALAAAGYVVVRVALRQTDARAALAQGLVVGPALWGLITNFVLNLVPGLAGAALGWGVVLVLGAVLAWRAPCPVWPRARVAAGFTVAVLSLLWLTLASRQLLESPDPTLHLGLSAWIRAGGFPPEAPWNPGSPLRYHHGGDLLVGLLTPPVGPDLAFTQELLGAYAWTAFALVGVTALLRRSSWTVALVVAPLLLTAGAWTWTNLGGGILRLPVLAGAPAAGSWEALADVYWPSLGPSWPSEPGALHDIWTPAFTLGYGLTLVVLERAARSERTTWHGNLTLGALVGFIGILVTSLAPAVLVLWAALAAVHVVRDRPGGAVVLRLGAGLGLAVLLMLFGGGAFTGLLDGGPANGLGLSWDVDRPRWGALGTLDARPGGIGVLGVGPLVAAALAVVLARRDRLVLALAAGAALLLASWLVLSYSPAPWVLSRLAGHARNLALLALLLGLTTRLSSLESGRWRNAASLVLVGLVVWPTIAGPVRSLAAATADGVQLANADWVQRETHGQIRAESIRRFQMPAISERLTSYIRAHTPLRARVLTPDWPYWAVSLATGRPSGAGFADLSHLIYFTGPEYLDAVHYLEPAAIRRLGIGYIHATDAWTDALPPRARGWLADPDFFEFLEHDGAETIYRVRQAFLALEVPPHPESFEALRSAPSSTVVHLAPELGWLDGLRVASALSHTRLTGEIDTQHLHLQAPVPWMLEPLGERSPDLIALLVSVEPPPTPSVEWIRFWRNDDIAVYADARWLKTLP